MFKFTVSCFLTLMICIASIMTLTGGGGDGGVLEGERRKRFEFPGFPKDLRSSSVREYFRQTELSLADAFPGRGAALAAAAQVYAIIGDNLDLDKCYRGKEGWLFLGNWYNRCVDKLQGLCPWDAKSLKRSSKRYETLADISERHGAGFAVFVGPNKSSVYPEKLPPVIVPAEQRHSAFLTEELRKLGIKVYDPTIDLKNAKHKGILYYRTDTHWNSLGAFEAFKGFASFCGSAIVPAFHFAPGPQIPGDLTVIGSYAFFSPNDALPVYTLFRSFAQSSGVVIPPVLHFGPDPEVPKEQAKSAAVIFPLSPGDNYLASPVEGRIVATRETGGNSSQNIPEERAVSKGKNGSNDLFQGNGTVWVLGDSFLTALKPFFEATYSDVRFFAHIDPRDLGKELASSPPPERIVFVVVERDY